MKILSATIVMSISAINLLSQPPQAAIDACRSMNANSACTVNTPRGNLSGICRRPPRLSTLVCVPEGKHPQNNMRQNSSRQNSSQEPLERGRAKRKHTVTQSSGVVQTLGANTPPITSNKIAVRIEGNDRILSSNGVSKHLTGPFPNQGNPNAIEEQNYEFKIPANPRVSRTTTPLGMHDFGLGINGVPFDPGAAEWYLGNRNSPWQYEALSGAISLGLDENHAHVQPTGAYHYHGLPSLLLSGSALSNQAHSPLIGWAADGFPIYALYTYKDANKKNSEIVEVTSSYRLRSGKRPSGGNNPGGNYDGAFLADYEYVKGLGSLDECNGKITVTPEFQNGTYAYFLSESWPVIPRCFKGTPSKDFTQQRAR